MRRWAVPVVVAALGLNSAAWGDMGRVLIGEKTVQVSEDSQKAIILHNGQEEVLVLGTELRTSRETRIIRFIPFPAEPHVQPAPPRAFDKLANTVDKYRLAFLTRAQTKGGQQGKTEGVEVLTSTKLGAHDLTVIRIRDTETFRDWLHARLRSRGSDETAAFPAEEAIVADYVRRGFEYFVLDEVELPAEKRFIEPIAYRFSSQDLYYPLKTSNSFGGSGAIELFVVAPATLCAPGSNDPVAVFRGENYDLAVTAPGEPARRCLNLPVKASTSARLVPEERDLAEVYPGWEAFFAGRPMFLQAIRYSGAYEFQDDVIVPITGVAKALGPESAPPSSPRSGPLAALDELGPATDPRCARPPERGVCKANFEAYHFVAGERVCKPFFWGGCGVAPFETKEECESVCVRH